MTPESTASILRRALLASLPGLDSAQCSYPSVVTVRESKDRWPTGAQLTHFGKDRDVRARRVAFGPVAMGAQRADSAKALSGLFEPMRPLVG